MWLWPPIVQRELDHFREVANNRRVRKQKDKILPSGVSPSYAYTFPEDYGGVDCLQPVDREVIEEVLHDLEPEMVALTDWGVPPEFARRAQAICDMINLKVNQVSINEVWVAFSAILAHL